MRAMARLYVDFLMWLCSATGDIGGCALLNNRWWSALYRYGYPDSSRLAQTRK